MSTVLQSIEQAQLLDLDPATTQIITVNNRSARRVLGFFQRYLQQPGTAMAIAEVLPLSAWYQRAEDELCLLGDSMPAAYVLDNFSAQQVWESIIAQSGPLIDAAQAAKLAHEADRLLDEYAIEVKAGEQSADYEHFIEWRADYERYLEAFDLDDQNRSIARLITAFEQNVLRLNKTQLVWVGFHEFSPRLVQLQKILAQQGVAQFSLQWSASTAQTLWQVQADTAEHEWVLAAQWAQEQLNAHPDGRFAIVASQLESDAPYARRVLDQHLQHRWNMAIGRPLSDWPQVRQMLAQLEILATWLRAFARAPEHPRATPEELGPALVGGCFGGAVLIEAGAQIDAQWRLRQTMSLSFSQWQGLLETHAPEFYKLWADAWALLSETKKQQSAEHWVEVFRALFTQLQLPGKQGIDSVTYQVLQAFEQRLAQFAQYGIALGALSFGRALAVFKRLCQETLFQPERDPRARLDVLGLLEAEGGQWDGVWMLGLTDTVFPAPPKPNPFIPYAAMERAEAPRATPEREFRWAQDVFMRLLQSAPQMWFSAAQFEGEQMLRPSPFIADFPVQDRPDLVAEIVAAECVTELDVVAPPIQADERVGGGAALLDTFARNPLWAFARYRLHAQALPDYARLSQAHLLGNFIHQLLEAIWQQLPQRDRAGLQRSLDNGYVTERLAQLAQTISAQMLLECPPSIAELINQWGQEVVYQWLCFEAKRTLDFECLAVEKRVHLQCAEHLLLDLRLDRIDRLRADGRLLLIDYKTGANAKLPHNQWQRTPPIELQLPLYAGVLHQQKQAVGAVAIARVNVLDFAFDGLGDEIEEPGCRRYDEEEHRWSDQLELWLEQCLALGQSFAQGQAHNHVIDRRDLTYCDVLAFLRITPQGEYYEQ